jgi:hypothetical protein
LKHNQIKITYSQGCFDEISEEMTQEELDTLKEQIEAMVISGELFKNAVKLLPEEEDILLNQLYKTKKNTRQ